MRRGWQAFADDDASRPEQPLREVVAALELLNYDSFGVFRRLNVADGFMKIGIKRMACMCNDFFEAKLRQYAPKPGMNLAQAIEKCVIGLGCGWSLGRL